MLSKEEIKLNKLEYIKLKVTLKCMEDCILPAYLGSTLRGAIGRELKKLSCMSPKQADCRKCANTHLCCYTKVFSSVTNEHDGWGKATNALPNPFIIEPPMDCKRDYYAGENLCFNLIFIGDGISYLPYFIFAVNGMAVNGLGVSRKKFALEGVERFDTGESIFINGVFDHTAVKLTKWEDKTYEGKVDEVSVKFLTPFRFRLDGKMYDSLNFEIFLRNILRRMSMLASCYCGGEWQINYKDLLEKSRTIAVKRLNTEWHDWERYSSRIQGKVKMGGIVGEVVFKGKLSPFLPYINIGSALHIGKGCTMGLGKYEYKT